MKKDFLVIKFSILSFGIFSIIIFIVVGGIRPVFENFVIAERKNDTVVFVNKIANNLLSPLDFDINKIVENKSKLEHFTNSVVRGSVQSFLTDASGTVIYSYPLNALGINFGNNEVIKLAIDKRRPIAKFEEVNLKDEETLGIKEAFIEGIPITFGSSEDVSGVLYTISRVGLIRKQITESERDMATRIITGLVFLYLTLLIIVWGASKTIRNQSRELESYAKTLEQKISERTEKLKESTDRQLEQAEELSKIKDEFIFIASHELRSPVTTIVGNSEILINDPLIKKLPPKTTGPIEDLRHAGVRLQILVNDLLDISRLEYGSVKIEFESIDLSSIILDSVEDVRDFADQKKIILEVNEDEVRKLPKIKADASRLKEVFNNLLTNAIKYNKPNGNVSIGGSVDVLTEQSNQMVAIHIKDTGIGLSEEEQKKIFTKFWRANQEVEGTGLGLWITKQLVNKMNGEITMDSKKGEGSTFTVWFHTSNI